MSRISFLQDMLASVLDFRGADAPEEDSRTLVELCEALLSSRGEVSGSRLTGSILQRFAEGDENQTLEFFNWMVESLDIDTDTAAIAINQYKHDPSPSNWQSLVDATEPRRLELLRRINRAAGATEQLVSMREQLNRFSRKHKQLARVDADFERLFKSWFNRGFLMLREIDWRTPANILEKIIRHEAVHAINDWQDLRRRLEPPDRKCFAFFHPAMQEEPLIFVEVALTSSLPESIQSVLSPDREPMASEEATTAVFYSISNCQPGLRGVSFGNFLIKHVATELAVSYPNIKQYRTLSPIPGFARWLETQNELNPTSGTVIAGDTVDTALPGKFSTDEKSSDAEDSIFSAELLQAACSRAIDYRASLHDKRILESLDRKDKDKADAAEESNSSDTATVSATSATPVNPEETNESVAELARLAAYYLVKVKRADNQPLDPVARFHLGNGAALDAVVADADLSTKGVAQSAGAMVSYLYDLDKVIAQHEAYASEQVVAHSKPVAKLLDDSSDSGRFRLPGVRLTG